MKSTDIPELKVLSVSEKLLLVEDLWSEIAAELESLPLPQWHVQALEESAAEYKVNPIEGTPWTVVRARILARIPNG
jgi:putative addiction module component (TIGR02574 family)